MKILLFGSGGPKEEEKFAPKYSTVKILKMLGDSKALVQFERNNFVVEIQNNQTFQLDQEVEVTEIDGKLSI